MSSTRLNSSKTNESDESFDMDKTIDSYIESSSLSNRMRDDNPNLQPIEEDMSANIEKIQMQRQKEEYERARDMVDSSPASSESGLSSASNSGLLRRFKSLSLKSETDMSQRFSGMKKPFSLDRHRTNKYEAPPVYEMRSSSTLTSSDTRTSSGNTEKEENDEDYWTASSNRSYENEELRFWKYHILKFGKDLYLTTNPTTKYLYCRPGPGIYVQVDYDKNAHASKRDRGFTLKITDIESIYSKLPPRLIITKESGQNAFIEVSYPPSKGNGNRRSRRKPPQSESVAVPTRIKEDYFAYEKLGSDRNVHLTNYEFSDSNGVPWNIGRIPRLKRRQRNKIKKIGSGFSEDNPTAYKLSGKKNIYFHQNYIGKPLDPKTSYRVCPATSFMYDKSPFPPVLAHFRPYESDITKRLKHSVSKNFHRLSSHPNAIQDRIRSDTIENDIGAGSKINNYFTGSDGLYYVESQSDDAPNSDKLGWITIYEDESLFSRIPCPMFDLVLGLTLTVGIQESLSSS